MLQKKGFYQVFALDAKNDAQNTHGAQQEFEA